MIEKKEFNDNKKITINEISSSTGINRATLSKIMNSRGHSTVTENIDRLCQFFDCKVEDIIEYVPNETLNR